MFSLFVKAIIDITDVQETPGSAVKIIAINKIRAGNWIRRVGVKSLPATHKVHTLSVER